MRTCWTIECGCRWVMNDLEWKLMSTTGHRWTNWNLTAVNHRASDPDWTESCWYGSLSFQDWHSSSDWASVWTNWAAKRATAAAGVAFAGAVTAPFLSRPLNSDRETRNHSASNGQVLLSMLVDADWHDLKHLSLIVHLMACEDDPV